jgi:hypothetical protein
VKEASPFPLLKVRKDFHFRGGGPDFRGATVIEFVEDNFKRTVLLVEDRIYVYKSSKGLISVTKVHELDYYIRNIILVDRSWIYALQEDKINK